MKNFNAPTFIAAQRKLLTISNFLKLLAANGEQGVWVSCCGIVGCSAQECGRCYLKIYFKGLKINFNDQAQLKKSDMILK